MARLRIVAGVGSVVIIGVLAAAGLSSGATKSASADRSLDTLKPGVLKVAIESYAPYTSLKRGKLVGLDSDIINAVARKLNLRIETVVTDFPGMLASVQSRRVDITLGGVAWSADRQKVGLFTDPPYYSPPAMAVRSGKTYKTVKDLEGLDLGTVSGYVWVKSIKSIPGAKLHAYPNAPAVFDDLGAGRIDVGFLDPLLIIAAQKQRPELRIKTEYLTPPTQAQVKEHPAYEYLRPYMTGFYVPRQEPKLEQAVTAQIRAMYKNGELAKLITKWGGAPAQFLKPSSWMAGLRRGLDRPSGWVPPSA
ncbi:MAG TPA: transporter substrate-binding domain-containing protein [Gaiellaceae bacterium]